MKRPLLFVLATLSMFWAASPAKAAAEDARTREAQDSIEAKAGELRLTLRRSTNGIGVVGLRDLTLNEQLLATNTPPLFSVTFRHAQTKQELRLTAEDGWFRTSVRRKRNGLELQWRQPTNELVSAMTVIATATPGFGR